MKASEVCEKALKKKKWEKNEEKVPSKQSIEMKGTHFFRCFCTAIAEGCANFSAIEFSRTHTRMNEEKMLFMFDNRHEIAEQKS